MPKYDYRCTPCDTVFEVDRPMSAKGDELCPQCNEPATKLFSPVGVAFKGTGFHNTDYRPRPKEPGDSTAKPDPTPCAAKSDSTPACASCPAAAAD